METKDSTSLDDHGIEPSKRKNELKTYLNLYQ